MEYSMYGDEIAFDYGQVSDCAYRLEDYLADLRDKNGKLQSLLDYLPKVWQGISADAAYNELSEMLDLVDQTIINLERLVDRYQNQAKRMADYM